MQLFHKPKKILWTGMSGCGKSIAFTRFIMNSRYNFYFIFDHDGQFAQRLKMRAARTDAEILAALKRGFVVFDPSLKFPGCLPQAATWFCKYVFQMSSKLPGSKLFCCDEIQALVGVNSITPEFAAILECGRNRALDFAGCTLGWNTIHNRIRAQINESAVYRTEEDAALNGAKARGFDLNEVRNLAPGRYILRAENVFYRGRVF